MDSDFFIEAKAQRDLPPFRYFDQGSLAVIGRWAAVANAFGVHLSGFLAWIVWACIHVINLVTFQNRFLVFFQLAIQELTFSRGARLITGTAPTDFSFSAWAARSPPKPPPTMITRHELFTDISRFILVSGLVTSSEIRS